MPLFNPGDWTATKRVLINGSFFDRGQQVPAADLMAERKRDVLINRRFVVPQFDLHLRKTDNYGFGDAPRKHPTPAFHSARLMRDLPVWPVGPRSAVVLAVTSTTTAPKKARRAPKVEVAQAAEPVVTAGDGGE